VTVIFVMFFGERLGGAEATLWNLLRLLDRDRIMPQVVFLTPGSFPGEIAKLGIRTYVMPSGRLRQVRQGVRAIFGLARLLRRERPDLVLSWFTKAQLYAAPAALLAGLGDRVAWWQHGVPVGGSDERMATWLPAKAIGVYAENVAEAQRRLRPRRPIVTVPLGIDDPEPVDAAKRSALRASLGLRPGQRVVGIVGRLQPIKGQHTFVRVVADLVRRGHDVRGLVVGGDAHNIAPDYLPELRALSRRLGIEDRVTFTGHVPDAKPYVALMDVFVSACTLEAFGLAILEAMALRVPVVAVGIAGPAELVSDGDSGLLTATNDPEELASAVERLLLDPTLHERIATGGRRRYEERYSSAGTIELMERCLERLATPGELPR
jgi:glycosyltransferase involved in cell wall biosynthesis